MQEQESGPEPDLPGRAELLDELGDALSRGQRPVVVVVALRDLDGLTGGDDDANTRVVGTTARRLSRLVRSSDLLARLDGDAFAVAGAGVAGGGVDALVERIRGAVAFPCEAGGEMVSLVADVGWAAADDTSSADTLVAAAEADLAQRRA